MPKEKNGVLKGLRVIDFGQYIAGPLAAMMLGDYGADVIHVDPPGGPVWDGWKANAVLMRGKRCISLNLKEGGDLQIARDLIASADIVVENFRPGVMDRLGLGWELCRELNPRLIYCSLPGYSRRDEKRRGLPGWEGTICAEGGLYSGVDMRSRKAFFRFDALPLASLFAAVIACHSIAAALIVRRKSGLGQFVESALYDACFEVDSTRAVDRNTWMWPPELERKVEETHSSPLLRMMAQHPCRDGRYIQTTPPPRGGVKLCRAVFPAEWLTEGPPENADEEVRKVMLSRTMREWERFAQEVHGAGVASSLTSEEWLHEPHALDSRTVIPVKDPVLGDTLQPGVPSLMLRSGDAAGLPRHMPDADRAEILSELKALKNAPPAADAAHRFGSAAPEPPLKGVKVLDLSQVVAGPTCGRLLAEYGAEVIKINNPRIMDNYTALAGHETQFNGKKTIFLDLKSPEGKAVMETLIREADVFHSNFAQAAYAHLNYTEEALRERNPGIILSQVNIHSLGGGREWFRGHEDLGEAITGMSMRYGGTLKPDTLPLLVLDHMTGQMSAFGVLLAIYARMLDGEGQRVQACLSRSSTLAQLPFMLGYAGKVWDEPAGPECWGYGVFDRIYHAKDRPFYLAASPEQLKAVPELRGVAWETAASLPYQLERLFGQETCEHWVSLLRSRGVAAAPCRVYQAEFAGDEYAYASGIARMENHPGLGMLRTVHCPPRMSLTPPQPCYPGSAPGTDTEAFLREFRAAHPGAGK